MKEAHNVNERIIAPEVRLVGDNVTSGIYRLSDALGIAETQELDLVEISSAGDMPVCRVIDYAKFKYLQKRKHKEIKSNAQKVVIKQIRFGPNTSDHDFDFKLKHAINFLETGAKVKVCVRFIGRQIMFKERGELILLRFSKELESYGKLEQLPKLEGKKVMSLTIAPLGAKK
ncbi:translation initiation factor IF-3 [Cardinium endosymbiont of Culicoides punctatus]|uniref:translation initiation factor IF-3 n=1 Tax=Cardinium endosymbiont of Culicoides punctatus TaxID=2304601 RepID=UPI00105881F9|nr:translation initiation factor IF-3 [Cardinium endosymbiont of Culicoides punctatus]TDG95578.1 Translation initiation factor IF-3 [Cardinium endosymbiont of Culicoides punctatus]